MSIAVYIKTESSDDYLFSIDEYDYISNMIVVNSDGKYINV